ncbi:hypothetical protein EIM44_07250 [Bibersteinia trehalosi]|uniref:Uncharacterized protein n=1 Tax=Bibersteinia trehalosi TaxID=47735 RepID=A0A3R8NGF1_BIBTR|nr:hypothetical protein [Bibersteinia trehalosi]RRN02698.1 hypothetical protein EIM44_07250 [Bibersteinia trehalosi]
MALGQHAKSDIEKNITEYVKKEQPIIYQTVEGTYYFLSATGKAVYLTREIVLDIAPLLIAPEVTAGTKAFVWTSRAALGAGANVASQKLSGQDFNTVEMVGATVSSVVTPSLKTAKDVVRFNAGVGMATGLVNGGNGLQDAALSGIASYGSSKISNPVLSITIGELIQKLPVVFESMKSKNEEE